MTVGRDARRTCRHGAYGQLPIAGGRSEPFLPVGLLA